MARSLREIARPVAATRVGDKAQRKLAGAVGAVRRLECIDRPAWLYRANGAVPFVRLHFREARQVTVADEAICSRLIAAFREAQVDEPKTTGIWSQDVFQQRQRPLTDALQKGDPSVLAERLAEMFRADFVLGMAIGSLGIAPRSRPAERLICLPILSKLAALGEWQGTVRVENPEQGEAGAAFTDGLEALVTNVESALGTSLDFPDVGAAYGIEIGSRLISFDSADQVYAAARIREAARAYLPANDRPLRIVEIGGGYGGMAYWVLQMLQPAEYALVDLPIVNVLQGYFLAQALGESVVSFYGEPARRVRVLPTHAIGEIALPFDVLANKDSMPEIPRDAAVEYLAWARDGCDGLFYSYNQEAAALTDGVRQNVVADIVAAVGGFSRLRRELSWARPGYVEEIYELVRPSGADLSGRPSGTQK
jgi:hypothetical protein